TVRPVVPLSLCDRPRDVQPRARRGIGMDRLGGSSPQLRSDLGRGAAELHSHLRSTHCRCLRPPLSRGDTTVLDAPGLDLHPPTLANGDVAFAPYPRVSPWYDPLLEAIKKRTAKVGVIGLGYVGLPLALAFSEAGFRVLGFDVDPRKVGRLQ